MYYEPKDLKIKLEFNKVLELLSRECVGELGMEAVMEIEPQLELEKIYGLLREVDEFKATFKEKIYIPVSAYFDLDEDLKMLAIEGYVLGEDSLQRIAKNLWSFKKINNFFKGERCERYPFLYELVKEVPFDDTLIQDIEKVIDEEGKIKPDASPNLIVIRRAIGNKIKELEKVFRVVINKYKTKGWLADNVESFRNGRRVLSVPSENKRKIRGIIHDESTTGKTAYIEPEEVIEINNDIFDLETEERKEIYRILKSLSETLRPYTNLFKVYQHLLTRFDVIQAKAKLARTMEANLPIVLPSPSFKIINGRHPLLYVKNKGLGKPTIPFNLEFKNNNRILLLSGPNAGGKSITLKSVGLMQLMLQSGLLIPVDEHSEIGLFNKIFTDIGDQQSIEDDLSTYSSRLQNMQSFLQHADEYTLVLIDEFGSGTDPNIGGSIAEGILKELNQRKVFGVITTHYSNLKIFAFKTQGIVNGSMHFDKDTLSPTYELYVGRPGSSYAFEIAQKSGLDRRVIQYAKHKTGKDEKAVDQLLIDLQREKQEYEELLLTLREKEDKLDKLVKSYEFMFKELEGKRKRLKLEIKEQEWIQKSADNKVLENLIREIKEKQDLAKAKKLSKEIKEQRKEVEEELSTLREEVFERRTTVKTGELKEGDFVRMREGGAIGQIEKLDKKQAIVLMGQLRLNARVQDLEPAGIPLEQQSQKSVKTDIVSSTAGFESSIDLRGMRVEEAIKLLEQFVDNALMSSANHLRIVHGKGTGMLRNAVKKKLREYKVGMDVSHPPHEQGGDGVTLVEIY